MTAPATACSSPLMGSHRSDPSVRRQGGEWLDGSSPPSFLPGAQFHCHRPACFGQAQPSSSPTMLARRSGEALMEAVHGGLYVFTDGGYQLLRVEWSVVVGGVL